MTFNISEGVDPQSDFTPPKLSAFSLSSQDIAAGARLHINYSALEVDSNIREVQFRYVNDAGNSIYLYDYENDGVATTRISENQLNGEYKLDYIQLRDTAYNPNYITYRADGNSQSHTNWQNYTDGTHDFDFSTTSITVSGGRSPQSDFTPLNFPHLV